MSIIWESIIKILTVIVINLIFLFIYGYNNFEIDLISKLNYVVYAGFVIILLLMVFEYFKLFKNYYLKVIIITVVNTVLVVISSILSLSVYLLVLSNIINEKQIGILFGSLIFTLILTIITLKFIDKRATKITEQA